MSEPSAPRTAIEERLDNQIDWFGTKASENQLRYRCLKVVTIVAGASVPVSALLPFDKFVTAGVGVLLVVVEGLQQLFQFHTNWISYRATCEHLKSERSMYLGKAGPYAGGGNLEALLTERVEAVLTQEHARWFSLHEKSGSLKPAAEPKP
jgi:hypothetical protein